MIRSRLMFIPVLVLLTACSHKMNFAPSSVLPASEGNVKVKKTGYCDQCLSWGENEGPGNVYHK